MRPRIFHWTVAVGLLFPKELLYRYAIPLYRPAADAGDGYDARRLADLLAKHGDLGELRARVDTGDGRAGRSREACSLTRGNDALPLLTRRLSCDLQRFRDGLGPGLVARSRMPRSRLLPGWCSGECSLATAESALCGEGYGVPDVHPGAAEYAPVVGALRWRP